MYNNLETGLFTYSGKAITKVAAVWVEHRIDIPIIQDSVGVHQL